MKFDEKLHLEGVKCAVTPCLHHNVTMVNILTVHSEVFVEELEW